LSPKQREYVGYILGSGHHLLGLVNEVLDLARIESGGLKLSIERVNVGDALEEVRRIVLPLAQGAGVTLRMSVPDRIPDIRADRQRLHQILLNLVSNAIKYNRKGGTVTLGARDLGAGKIRLDVTDTGIGIAPERRQELFQPFQRLGAEHSNVEGTGIGLALSRKLVEALSGTIGFTSEPGVGSDFWIELPAELAPAPATLSETSGTSAPPPSRAHAGGYTLLYVEDNPSSLKLMEMLVSTLPTVSMLAAPTPQLGIELAAAHRPDVIVLDLNLPHMNGIEVLAQLKTIPETRAIPVLALTAAALPHDVRRGLAAGFFRYLTKPLDVKLFLAAVDDALAQTSESRAGDRPASRRGPRG
jgi:CheY-like chemotaxis protein